MNLNEFTEQVASQIKQYLPQEYQQIDILSGSMFVAEDKRQALYTPLGKDQGFLAVAMDYYYEFYQQGEDMTSILRQIASDFVEEYQRAQKPGRLAFAKEELMACLHIAVVNFEQNKEALRDLPYLKLHDLAVIPLLALPENHHIPLSLTNIKAFELSESQVLEHAMKNHTSVLPPVLWSMQDVLMCQDNPVEMDGTVISEESNQQDFMYVLSNKQKMFGAAVITDREYLHQISQKLGGDYYILPSSIDELILIPYREEFSLSELRELVKGVNAKKVNADQFLSNSVYMYHAKEKSLEVYDGTKRPKKEERHTDKGER